MVHTLASKTIMIKDEYTHGIHYSIAIVTINSQMERGERCLGAGVAAASGSCVGMSSSVFGSSPFCSTSSSLGGSLSPSLGLSVSASGVGSFLSPSSSFGSSTGGVSSLVGGGVASFTGSGVSSFCSFSSSFFSSGSGVFAGVGSGVFSTGSGVFSAGSVVGGSS